MSLSSDTIAVLILQLIIAVATVFAIVYGPVKAVKVTRDADREQEKRDRKYVVLSDLMKTRRRRIDPVHVGALNLIELEFYNETAIISAYRNYAAYLNQSYPQEHDAFQRHLDHGDDLFVELLYQIAQSLGFSFDKRDLTRLGYFPQGLSQLEDNSMTNALLAREILEGRRPLPVTNFVSGGSQYPPVPDD